MWEHAWSTARSLGLSDDEFYRLTPRKLGLLKDRKDEALAHQELLIGIAVATLANHSFGMPKEPYSPADFMPTQLAKKHRELKKAQGLSPDELDHNIRVVMQSFMAVQ